MKQKIRNNNETNNKQYETIMKQTNNKQTIFGHKRIK